MACKNNNPSLPYQNWGILNYIDMEPLSSELQKCTDNSNECITAAHICLNRYMGKKGYE